MGRRARRALQLLMGGGLLLFAVSVLVCTGLACPFLTEQVGSHAGWRMVPVGLKFGLPLVAAAVGLLLTRPIPVAVAHQGRRVLYLRPFAGDSLAAGTEEAELARLLAGAGRLTTFGAREDLLAPVGAERVYVPFDAWQTEILALLREVDLVVLTIGTSPSLLWEVEQIVRLRDPATVLFHLPLGTVHPGPLVELGIDRPRGPPHPAETRYPAFRTLVSDVLPQLPADPGEASLIAFDPGWAPRLLTPRPSRGFASWGEWSPVRRRLWSALDPLFQEGRIPPPPARFGGPDTWAREERRAWIRAALTLVAAIGILGWTVGVILWRVFGGAG